MITLNNLFRFEFKIEFEAKLIDFDHLISSKQLNDQLVNRRCSSDSDCQYNHLCTTKCNLKTKRCTLQLNNLQIINYCRFVERYLFDSDEFKKNMQPIIQRCLTIKSFDDDQFMSSNKSVMYLKNEMPIRFNNLKTHIAQSQYWKLSTDYTNIINELQSSLCMIINKSSLI